MEIENDMDEFEKCYVQQSNGKRFEFRTTQLSNTGLRRQSNKQRHKKILCGRPLMTWPPMMININSHRAGLNRGVPMCRSTQIMGGSFRRGLTSELVTFSTARAVPPSLLYKSNGWKSKMAASHFCILPSDWPERLLYSGPALCWECAIVSKLIAYPLVCTQNFFERVESLKTLPFPPYFLKSCSVYER